MQTIFNNKKYELNKSLLIRIKHKAIRLKVWYKLE